MTVLTILIGLLAYLACYFGIGWTLARRDLPVAWNRARNQWRSEDYVRDSVRSQTLAMTFFWPIVTAVRWMRDRLDGLASAADPKAREMALERREREISEREQVIRRLEQELGIGGQS